MKEQVLEMKKELDELRNENFALEILKDYKKQNKRLFIIWIITFVALLGLACYTIYLLNDIGTTEEEIIEIQEVETINESTIKIGDEIWEKSN